MVAQVRPQKVQSYEDLIVWQRAMDLVDEAYRLARKFPRSELFALKSQLTRAAVSVPANIAEGQGRGTMRDFANFLANAKGSLYEVGTHLHVAVRQGYIAREDADRAFALGVEISKMLTSLRKRIVQAKAQ